MAGTPSFLTDALRKSVRYQVFWSIVFFITELFAFVGKTGHQMKMKEGILGFTFLAGWGAVMVFCSTKPVQPNKAFVLS